MPMYKSGYEVNVREIAVSLAKKPRPIGNSKVKIGIATEAVNTAALKIMNDFNLLPKKKKSGPSKYLLGKNGKQWTVEEKKYRCRTWHTIATFEYEAEAREYLASL